MLSIHTVHMYMHIMYIDVHTYCTYILYSTYSIDDDVKRDCQPLLAGGVSRVVTPICLVWGPIGLVLLWWCSRFTISLHSIPRASPLVHRCIAHTRWCPSPPPPAGPPTVANVQKAPPPVATKWGQQAIWPWQCWWRWQQVGQEWWNKAAKTRGKAKEKDIQWQLVEQQLATFKGYIGFYKLLHEHTPVYQRVCVFMQFNHTIAIPIWCIYVELYAPEMLKVTVRVLVC